MTACKYEYWHASDETTLKQRVAVLSVLHQLSLKPLLRLCSASLISAFRSDTSRLFL